MKIRTNLKAGDKCYARNTVVARTGAYDTRDCYLECYNNFDFLMFIPKSREKLHDGGCYWYENQHDPYTW